jgi:hypothetical protein
LRLVTSGADGGYIMSKGLTKEELLSKLYVFSETRDVYSWQISHLKNQIENGFLVGSDTNINVFDQFSTELEHMGDIN